tara:strand:- start:134 stop:478 length:345 start_codon:yes stop_codon:yes gene_type:complete
MIHDTFAKNFKNTRYWDMSLYFVTSGEVVSLDFDKLRSPDNLNNEPHLFAIACDMLFDNKSTISYREKKYILMPSVVLDDYKNRNASFPLLLEIARLYDEWRKINDIYYEFYNL